MTEYEFSFDWFSEAIPVWSALFQKIPPVGKDGYTESFDFIYIDGSHKCADVLLDLSLAFMLCKPGGVITCDDYLWSNEPHGSEDFLNQPKLAIDSFVNCFRRKLEPIRLSPLCQFYFQKTHS